MFLAPVVLFVFHFILFIYKTKILESSLLIKKIVFLEFAISVPYRRYSTVSRVQNSHVSQTYQPHLIKIKIKLPDTSLICVGAYWTYRLWVCVRHQSIGILEYRGFSVGDLQCKIFTEIE